MAAEDPGPSVGPPVRRSVLACEVCGQETAHRILRWSRSRDGSIVGLARCQTCRWTHPFREAARAPAALWVVRSEGASSRRDRHELPGAVELVVGEALPGTEPGFVVRRLEGPGGVSVERGAARDLVTAWIARSEPGIPVSLIEGRATRPARWEPSPGAVVTVGAPLRVEGVPCFVVGFRARARTWRRPGDAMAAEEVTRVYARRILSPPAGSSRASRSSGIPNSFASSRSRTVRSRSSSGASRARIRPRAARDSGGATVQSVRPS